MDAGWGHPLAVLMVGKMVRQKDTPMAGRMAMQRDLQTVELLANLLAYLLVRYSGKLLVAETARSTAGKMEKMMDDQTVEEREHSTVLQRADKTAVSMVARRVEM